MSITKVQKAGGAVAYAGTPDDLSDLLGSALLGACSRTTASAAMPRHNEIVRAIDHVRVGMVRVILWTKYGNAPGVRMVTVEYDGLTWRVTDDDFIPSREHKVVTLYTDGTRPDPSPNTRDAYPSTRHALGQ